MKNSSWHSDVSWGIAAALSGLRLELVYRLLAVAPLGPTFIEHGLRAGLRSWVLTGLLDLLLRCSEERCCTTS